MREYGEYISEPIEIGHPHKNALVFIKTKASLIKK